MAEYKIFKNRRHEKEKETLTLLLVKSGDDNKQKETILEAFKQSISLSEKEKKFVWARITFLECKVWIIREAKRP